MFCSLKPLKPLACPRQPSKVTQGQHPLAAQRQYPPASQSQHSLASQSQHPHSTLSQHPLAAKSQHSLAVSASTHSQHRASTHSQLRASAHLRSHEALYDDATGCNLAQALLDALQLVCAGLLSALMHGLGCFQHSSVRKASCPFRLVRHKGSRTQARTRLHACISLVALVC